MASSVFISFNQGQTVIGDLIVGGVVQTADGSASAPSHSFSSDPTTGFYRSSTGVVRYASVGNDRFAFATALNLREDAPLQWVTSNTFGAISTTLIQDATNVLAQKNAASAQAFRVYGTTTGPKYLSLSHDGTNGVIDTAASSGLVSIAPTNATSVTIGKAITSLAGQTLSGALGAAGVVATGRSTAQTAAVGSVSTVTVGAADGSFEVSANILVTTATNHSFTCTCAYTDEGNTARTVTLNFFTVAGTTTVANTVANANGAIPYMGIPIHIRAKAATAITVATTGTFTTVTYNVEGIIKRTA